MCRAVFAGVFASVFSTAAFAAPAAFDAPPSARRLDPEQSVWVDTKAALVYVDGEVTQREGVLEMFACPKSTKEHESVVAVDADAFLVHTALLTIGAEPGSPVKFDPEYEPPRGAGIRVEVRWTDAAGDARTARAQDWVRNIDTGAAMRLPFVFAGSLFRVDPQTGEQEYLADYGDLICVSNFGTAMLDVPAPSTQSNAGLLFEPFTERVPPLGTPVRLVLGIEDETEAAAPQAGPLNELDEAIATLLAVRVGSGSTPAVQAAWGAVATVEPTAWPAVLRGLSEAGPLAANWLSSALTAASQNGTPTDADITALRGVLEDLSLAGPARRAAYELIVEHRPLLRERMLEGLVDDPNEQLRFDAVAQLLDRAEAIDEETAKRDAYRVAFRKARVLEQVEVAGDALETLGDEPSLIDQLGLIAAWSLIGPLDNTDGAGFDQVYAPEDLRDWDGAYQGKTTGDEPVRWQARRSGDRLAEIDLNTLVAAEKSAVAYAAVTIQSDATRDVQVRLSSSGATKVWLNERLVLANEVYHNGNQFDQCRAGVTLREGANELLVKICQNDQPQPWAQRWKFQARVCDATGGGVDGVTPTDPTDQSGEAAP
ncbi:MAG: YdjY domain-containing protein [Planctomycetota bacterium]